MTSIQKTQEHVLLGLLRKAGHTVWGKRYDFTTIKNYEDFRSRVPVKAYDSLKPVIERIKDGEPDILWPGEINNFAVSSGTSGSGKHLPLSNDRLRSDRCFMRKLIQRFVSQWPEPQIWFGKQASLPGSVEVVPYNDRNLIMGEISGFTAREAPEWFSPFQVVSPANLCRMSWKEKFDICLQLAIKEDVRVITAVPSWTLIFLQEAIRISGNNTVADLWPNLKLIVSGGVSLKNYKQSIENLCSPLSLRFMESYGASEGYFAYTRQFDKPELQLVIDNGVFYEWVPFEPGLSEDQLSDRSIPSWELETGCDYIMLVTTNSGLWRYPVNDIVRFTGLDPLYLEVRGRVSEMLDDYGEAVHYSELETALDDVGNTVSGKHRWLLATVHPPTTSSPPYHVWIIEWDENPGFDGARIAQLMDKHLISINRHYAIRRESQALSDPAVIFLEEQSESLLSRYLKFNAQGKPPHIVPFDNLPDWVKNHVKNPG